MFNTHFKLLPACCVAVVVVICGVVPASQARTWLVNAGGTGDAPTIQAAVDSVARGDSIVVAPGTYTWTNQSTTSQFAMVHIPRGKNDFFLVGQSGASATTLDGQFLGRVMFIAGFNNIVVDGFTITRGLAPQFGGRNGGGIAGHLSADLIRNCVFVNNQAEQGAAMWIGGVSPIRIENCEFYNNQADFGGALFFINTSATITVSGCHLHNNTALISGGAIYGWNAAYRLEGSVINGNSAAIAGGAIYGSNLNPSTVFQTTIVANSSADGSALSLIACPSFEIDHSIVAFGGGGVWMSLGSSPAVVSCSDIYGNAGGDNLPAGAVDAGGNISLDPLFCDASTGVFSLHADSPCVPGSTCGQIGAFGVSCGDVPVRPATWGQIKSRYQLE